MKRIALICLVAVTLSACVTPASGPVAGPALIAALDSQGDGYTGTTVRGERFEIISTAVSDSRLCRVVSIESTGRFEVESFCKARGGQWR